MAMAAVAVKRAGCVIRPPPSHAPVAASSGRRASRPEPHNSRPSGRCLTRSAPSLADPPTIARVLLLRRPPTRPIRSIPRGGRRRLQPVPGRRKPWIRPCSASARSSDHYPSQVHRPPVIFGCLLRHLIGHCSYQLKVPCTMTENIKLKLQRMVIISSELAHTHLLVTSLVRYQSGFMVKIRSCYHQYYYPWVVRKGTEITQLVALRELTSESFLSLPGITLLAVPEQEICLLNHPSGSASTDG
ncbi:uncharacterized protein LOC120674041 isoform X1 [Panicum virgatum]|uniref:uncharacterized protein LOC120674041 isoform X1 n=1 Tax=Panicum virgatum TaxID=38727 RepID=UPI0019D58C0C|nr:uncharacterized protein LOC120674041 isoform X1 [Panicum virgatum]XP_039811040.1 uncharacterized protein LOC120674041 isoform X1 [Panicum virgatum]